MLAVLVAIPTTTENSLHPLSTYSIIVFHPLDFMVQGKITEADAPVCLDTNCVFPHLHHSPFLHRMPFPPQSCQFILAWDRHHIMPACIPSGWFELHKYVTYPSFVREALSHDQRQFVHWNVVQFLRCVSGNPHTHTHTHTHVLIAVLHSPLRSQ